MTSSPPHHDAPAGTVASWCGRCGAALLSADGTAADHRRCEAALQLEPPRFCPWCRRRMVVQVVPAGWSARCSEHGDALRATSP